MKNYIFNLGSSTQIAKFELETYLSKNCSDYSSKLVEGRLHVSCETAIETSSIQKKLGGITSILEFITDAPNHADAIASYLEEVTENKKIKFTIRTKNRKLIYAVKEKLRDSGRNSRYIEYKNAATIIHNNLIESKSDVSIIDNKLYRTVAIQDIEEFTTRDYERPAADSLSGMLPPKLARMMINIGLNHLYVDNPAFLDPFCGSGTTLIEAMDLGISNIYGIDISEKAIDDSLTNVKWFKEIKGVQLNNIQIVKGDAQRIEEKLPKNAIELIASEPYMGVPLRGKETKDFIIRQKRSLEVLYSNALSSMAKVLKEKGVIVFIVPEFVSGGDVFIPKVDRVSGLREIHAPDLVYQRPGQKLQRHIHIYQKIST